MQSGTETDEISLNQGLNTIKISILAEDGTTSNEYYITVDKESANDFAQRAYLKASNTDEGDEFGYSVAVSNDTVVIGADCEDSNATGVTNGAGYSGTDEGSTDLSGAAYIFR